ncbi:MAG TPA: hypothetical protein VME41_13245 [Stellaceae bacterium]|nr:hypothetical protein [Stellaceae bacterium]
MAAIGWIAFGTLCTKVLAESSTLSDVTNYTMMAIGVCASSAALITASTRISNVMSRRDEVLLTQVAAMKSMAEQTPFAESRARLLAAAQRLEKR